MKYYDYIVVGSGLAGLYTAHKASKHGTVILLSKNKLRESTSYYAQGGIAAVTDMEDTSEIHYMDTIIAGRGLCEEEAVRILVNEGPERISEIIEEGMKFDSEGGKISLGLEAGHRRRRILHAGGDSTGRFITDFLISKVEKNPNITLAENFSVIDLLIRNKTCYGIRAWDETLEEEQLYSANSVVLAAGGTSAIYSRTTNPDVTVGDGIAMAYNAGCRIMDMEFVQFHPTSLFVEKMPKAFLISEAVRGEGAHILDKSGRRFMLSIHELAELAPRDIVARSIFKKMADDDLPYVILSLRHLNSEKLRERFPNINRKCQELGYDFTDSIPIAPAAHYTVGGVLSDENGKSDIERLFVCGEIASTGIMGANRLASNSLIECLVFGNRAVEASLALEKRTEFPEFYREYTKDKTKESEYYALKQLVSEILNNCSGIVRSETLLATGLSFVKKETAKLNKEVKEYYTEASRKLLTVAFLIMSAARYRRESRGGHFREDYPITKDEFLVHTIQQKEKSIKTVAVNKNRNND